jgi:hypothetical protein
LFDVLLSGSLDLYRGHVLAALVAACCVAWKWGVAVWTCLEPEALRFDILVHLLRKFSVTKKRASWLAGEC